jgi:hemolysin activation/secretion protein
MLTKLTAGLLTTLAVAAFAQTPVPPAAQAGQVEQQFVPEPQPRVRPSEIQIPPEMQQRPPENASTIRFRLKGVVIDGLTVFDLAPLATVYADRIGREVSLANIYTIANELTARYRNEGYILSQVIVPAQTVEGGVIRLQAIEGFVADVRIEGPRSMSGKVEVLAAKIKTTRPLSMAVLERYLLLINDLPDVHAKATLMASKTLSGAADLLIQVTERTMTAGLHLDNRGSRALGPARLTSELELNNRLGLDERIGIRFITTGNRELDYLSLSHEQYLGSEGGKVSVSVHATRSRPERAVATPLNLETSGTTLVLVYNHPVLRSRNENFYLRGTLTAHDGESEILDTVGTRDSIRALRLGTTYDLLDAWRGINIVDVEYSQGINDLGASAKNDPLLSRAGGRVDFRKLSWYAGRLQSLTENWSLLAALSGQHAFTSLLAPELYSFGGTQFGRGYDPSELVGDHGNAFKLELRRKNLIPGTTSATSYAFYNQGSVRQWNSAGLASRQTAASAGLGLKATLDRQISGFLELAKPLTRIVAAEGNRDLRIYAGLSIRF